MTAGSCATLLARLVERNLLLYLVEDAKFYAERLYYEHPCQEHLNILAQCYFRQGKVKQCYLILQGPSSQSLANRYLLATCCYSLGKLDEAEQALSPNGPPANVQAAASVPGGAAGLYLLGCIYRRSHRKDLAIKHFTLSLQMDATLWGSVTELSELGVQLDAAVLYGHSLDSALAALSSPSLPGPPEELGRPASMLENRRVAESRAGVDVDGTPRVALSLGLSSAFFQVPLATPGSMPSHSSAALAGNALGLGGAAEAGGIVPDSAALAYTDPRHALLGGDTTRGAAGGELSGLSGTGPRGTLFDMSTPGLTPIGPGRFDRTAATDAGSVGSAAYGGMGLGASGGHMGEFSLSRVGPGTGIALADSTLLHSGGLLGRQAGVVDLSLGAPTHSLNLGLASASAGLTSARGQGHGAASAATGGGPPGGTASELRAHCAPLLLRSR